MPSDVEMMSKDPHRKPPESLVWDGPWIVVILCA